jgi:hypothetical protein
LRFNVHRLSSANHSILGLGIVAAITIVGVQSLGALTYGIAVLATTDTTASDV